MALTKAMAENERRSFLDYPIAGGLLLRNATKEQVERQRDEHSILARANHCKAAWFARIAEMVPANKTVGQALTEAQVRAAYKATHK